jgi:membrane protein implicated in regulation of membrane protease activity
MFYAALFAWLLVFAFLFQTPLKGALFASAAAGIAALSYPYFHKTGAEKRLRKLHQEILGNDNSFVCEVELTETGFSVNQSNRLIRYDWQTVAEIKETSDSVDIFTRNGGGVIVRNRAFQSAADRLRFIDLANGFLTKAAVNNLERKQK